MSLKLGRNESCDKGGKELAEHDSFIYYTEPPSLQSIALVSVAVRLWIEPDMYFDTLNNLYSFSELKERVINKLTRMLIPDLLKTKISSVIEPIGLQLFETNYYLAEMNCDFRDILKIGGSIYYTMEGIIDNVKSLKEVIGKEGQVEDIGYLYELACKHCLEENVSYLWQNIHSEEKKEFYDTYYKTYDYNIVEYWTAYLENELPNLLSKMKPSDYKDIYDSNHSIFQNMTLMSVFVGNIFALKYFWKKLTEQEKNINIGNWINLVLVNLEKNILNVVDNVYQKYNPFADILFFLLSKLNDQSKQKIVFQTHSSLILKALFFCWPWQRFLLSTIARMFDYLSEDVFIGMMSDITEEIKEGRTTGELIREIWPLSPIKLKKSFISCMEGTLWNLLEVNDTRTIDMIMSNTSSEERRGIVFNIITYNDFTEIILCGKFTFLDTMIKNLLPTDDDSERLKISLLWDYKYVISLLIIRNDIETADAWLNWFSPAENGIGRFKKEIINPMKIYISLIRLNDYDRVNTFLNWYFERKEDITAFKKTFVQKSNFSRCFNLLIEMSDDHKTGWNRFERFTNYSLCCSGEVSQFKKLYMKSVPTFLKRGHLEFATNFLNWCFNSYDEINRYKNELLLSKKGIGMLLYLLNHTYFSWDSFRYRLRWFYPLSSETIDKLKSLKDSKFIGFCDEYAPENKKRAFIYLLECLASKAADRASDIMDNTDAKCIKNILKGKDINVDCNSDSSYSYDSEDNYANMACADDDFYDLLYY